MIQTDIVGDSWTEVAVPLPSLHGDGRIRLRYPETVRCVGPRVILDGTPLAVDVTQAEIGVLDVLVGPVSGATLVFSARAVSPITQTHHRARVECDDDAPIVVTLASTGVVRFLEGRSGWSVPATSHYGDTVEAKLHLRNDGTAALEGGRVCIALPSGVVPGFRCERREVDSEGHRVLIIDLPMLPVRGTEEIAVPLFVTDPSMKVLSVRAQILDAAGVQLALFDSTPSAITHRVTPMVTVHVRDSAPLRFGDEVRISVVINQGGSPLPDARLSVDGTYTHPIDIDLGPLQHGERRTIPLTLRLKTVSAMENWTDSVFVRLHSSAFGEDVVSYRLEVPCAGRALLKARARAAEADATRAHRIDVLVENRGDGVTVGPVLRGERKGDVCAVLDSLLVNGEPQYRADSSVPMFDDGVKLPDLGLGERCMVSFAVRSQTGGAFELPFTVTAASGSATCSVLAKLESAAARNAGLFDAEAAKIEDIPEFKAQEVLNITLPMQASEEAERDDAQPAPLAEPSGEPTLEYPETMSSIAREYVDDGQVALGRHVVALLSWLPTGATGSENLDMAAKQLASEVLTVQRLGQASLRAGFWGVSGILIATPSVRTAAELFAEANGLEYPGGGQMTALRWLAVQTQVPQQFADWKQAVINGLQSAADESDLETLMTFAVAEEVAA